ncbi:hypothetical protein LCGC14_1019770 [marine sediment metagenome]|uniref:Uncharacterized protein n=1 Tax=marine sediment metagenome TaxID=412755 RepID=A0A0F9QFX9_9ZZZZ
MKLGKAIEILSKKRVPVKTAEDHDVLAAIMLAIEALKRCKERSDRFPNIPHLLLPGETPEDTRDTSLVIEPRQAVENIKEEISRHFDNEMRLTDMLQEADLTQGESDYIWGAMRSHPHIVRSLHLLTPELYEKVVRRLATKGGNC